MTLALAELVRAATALLEDWKRHGIKVNVTHSGRIGKY